MGNTFTLALSPGEQILITLHTMKKWVASRKRRERKFIHGYV